MSKTGIAAIAVLVLLALGGGAAAAADIVDDDDKPTPPPDPIDEPDPPPPPAPPNNVCNFLGCPGFQLPSPRRDWTPTYAAIRLQQLGYNINPAAPGWSLLSGASMAKVLHFQQNYNRVAPTMSPPAPQIDTDGLFGPQTAIAVDRAWNEVKKRYQSWANIVALTPG